MTQFTVRAHVDWTAEEPATAVLLLRVAEAAGQRVLDEDLQVENAGVEDHGPRAGGGARPLRLDTSAGGGPPPLRGHRRGGPRTLDPAVTLPTWGELDLDLLSWTFAEPLLPLRRARTDRRATSSTPRSRTGGSARARSRELGRDQHRLRARERATCTPPPTRRCSGGPACAGTSPTSWRRSCAGSASRPGWSAPTRSTSNRRTSTRSSRRTTGRAWRLLDPTGLAPTGNARRGSPLGRDAADIAWGTTDGPLTLDRLEVAVARTELSARGRAGR